MPDNKRHHYVPRFYLRNFSSAPEQKTVRLFNVKRALIVPDAPIDRQCYRNYMYGKSGEMEKAFTDLEGEAATLFRELLKDEPDIDKGKPLASLFNFVAVQLGRTKAMETEYNEWAEQFAKYVLSRSRPDLAEHLDRVRISINSAVLLSVQNAILMRPILWDLTPVVLEAQNGAEFVASDNPVVLFNTLLEEPAVEGGPHMHGTRGWASRGLIIYFPISSSRAMVLHDPVAYSLAKRKVAVQPVFPNDVRQLNALQYFNARENVYFANAPMDKYVRELHAELAPKRVEQLSKLTVHTVSETADTRRELLTLTHPRAAYSPRLRFLSPKKQLMGRVSQGVRSEEWVRIVRGFSRKVDEGQLDWRKFPDYVEQEFARNFRR